MKIIRRILSVTGGQSLAELAIVLPLLILICLCAVDFGRVYYYFQSVESAATAGAQYGCVSSSQASDTAGIQQVALAQAQDISNSLPQVISSVNNNVLTVTVNATFRTAVRWPGLPNLYNLSRTVTVPVLN